MKPKRAIKELEKQIRKDADNLVLRLKLAAAYREVGRTEDAVALYRSVAIAYHSQGRLVQAIAVCKSVLEIEPSQRETQALLAELDHMRALQAAQDAAQAGYAREQFAPVEEVAEDPMPVPSIAGVAARRAPSPDEVAPVASGEFAQRSGLTPANADPDIRLPEELTPGSMTPGQQMRQLRSQAQQQRPPGRSTRRGFPAAKPGVRSSSGSISAYTPLPEPLALHDAVGDEDSLAAIPVPPRTPAPQPPLTQTARGRPQGGGMARVGLVKRPQPRVTSRRSVAPAPPRRPPPEPPSLPPPDEDDDAQTRVVEEHERISAQRDDDAPTTIAPDLDFTGGPDAVARRLGDDDAPTTIADESGLLSGLPLRPVASEPEPEAEPPRASPDPRNLPPIPESRPPAGPRSPGPALRRGGAARAAPSFFDRETRQIGGDEAARLIGSLGPEPDFDDLPTPPPLGMPPDQLDTPVPVELPTPPPMEPPRARPDPVPLPAMPRGRSRVSPDELITPLDMETPPEAAAVPTSSEDAATPIPGGVPPGRNEVTAAPRSDKPQDNRATAQIALPAELERFQRGNRLLDVSGSEPADDRRAPAGEEDDDSEETRPGPSPSDVVTAVSTKRPSRPRVADTDEEMELQQAFDRPFSDTIERLGPDGAVIEMPLSIFSALPDDALAELARRMTLRHFGNGSVVLREGEPGDACYVLANGEVRVLKRDPLKPRGDLIEVARLGSGALFGEFALLADRRRHATVQAVGDCDIYEIPRRLLRELAATFPAVGPLLEQFYRERLLATLLSTAPFFKPLPEERRGELLARFNPVRAESGHRVVTEGEPAGGLYLIVLGSVEITKRVSDKRSVLLATLGEGAYFGEMSLLKGGVACASATAVGPTELAMMSPRDFYQVVSDNPKLWDEVRREANRRQLENNQIVTGETNVV